MDELTNKNVRRRLTALEYKSLVANINKDDFYNIYLNNGNEFVCEFFNISLNVMYRLIKEFNIKLTNDQLRSRNKIATEQKIYKLYGVINNYQRQEVKDTIKQTNLKKYGVENPFQADYVKTKIKATNNSKLGVDYPTQSRAVREKIKYNNIAKYGVENVSQLDSVKEKMINTCLDKYGVEYSLQSQDVRIKIKETNLKKYGVMCVLQLPEILKHRRSLYILEDQTFDSLPELAVYIFSIDNNIQITRTPVVLHYIFNNQEYNYFPDFKIDEKLVEIKGDHFFKEDGTMQNPFDHSQDEKYEAKHQCMIKNNVEIWTSKQYKQAVDYLLTNYKIEDFKEKNKGVED